MMPFTRSAWRCSAFWNTCRKMPVLERSAGISAVFSQPPLAYSLKSSPGCTDLSMPATSMPMTGCAGAVAAGGAGVFAASSAVGVRVQATQAQMAIASRVGRERRMERSPVREGPAT